MVSFNYDDVIFLLNKWDIILFDDEEKMFFEELKEFIGSIWEKV